ncbi:ski2-like helicase [Capnocytophaga canimorsus]|nr:ski2-like helicase [Capnocytophaga canimorsus]
MPYEKKMINNIVCTTTLMQGVNIPAQNVIMRNGNIRLKKENGIMPKLTNYEISNLRGRAGRLLKDFIGRTFVLDQNAFENKAETITLFQDEEKSLKTGYSNIFEKYNKQINSLYLKILVAKKLIKT